MVIQIRIDNDKLVVSSPTTITSGSKNYYRLEAVFTTDWNNLGRYVIFPKQECSVALESDGSVVLPETLVAESGELTFGIIGLTADGTLRIATNYVQLRVLEGAQETHAKPPAPDKAATWQGYFDTIVQECIEEIRQKAAEIAVEAVNSELNNRFAAIEQKLNGISFDVDQNGNLTYEK